MLTRPRQPCGFSSSPSLRCAFSRSRRSAFPARARGPPDSVPSPASCSAAATRTTPTASPATLIRRPRTRHLGHPRGGLIAHEEPWHAPVRESAKRSARCPRTGSSPSAKGHHDLRFMTSEPERGAPGAHPSARLNREHTDRRWTTADEHPCSRCTPTSPGRGTFLTRHRAYLIPAGRFMPSASTGAVDRGVVVAACDGAGDLDLAAAGSSRSRRPCR